MAADVSLLGSAWHSVKDKNETTDEMVSHYGDMAFDLCMRLQLRFEDQGLLSRDLEQAWKTYLTQWQDHSERSNGFVNLARIYDETARPLKAADTWAETPRSSGQLRTRPLSE